MLRLFRTLLLLVIVGCSEEHAPPSMDHLPYPLSELQGVHPGMSLESLLQVRPEVTGDIESGIGEELGMYSIRYRFEIESGLGYIAKPGGLESVTVSRALENSDSLGEGIATILESFVDSAAVCWERKDKRFSPQIGRRLEAYELLVSINPARTTRSIEGSTTIPARTVIIWRAYQPSRNLLTQVECPVPMASTQVWSNDV